MNTIQICFNTTYQNRLGLDSPWMVTSPLQESIIQQIFTKKKSSFLVDLMEIWDTQISIHMIWELNLGLKWLDLGISPLIDLVILQSCTTTLCIALEAGMVILQWMTFINIRLRLTSGMTSRSKKGRNHYVDTDIQLL